MKRLAFLAATATLLLASCSSDDFATEVTAPGQEVEVTFSAALPAEMLSRAVSDGETANRLNYTVFKDDKAIFSGIVSNAFQTTKKQETVSIPLITGETYNIVFWADNSGSQYSYKDGVVTIDYTTTGIKANDETADAFFGNKLSFTVNGATSEEVKLTRPFAQINFGTTEEDYNAVKDLKLEITQTAVSITGTTYGTLNLLTGKVDDETDVNFVLNKIPSDPKTLSVNGTDYVYVGYAYVLTEAENDAELLSEVVLTPNEGGANNLTRSYTNVPIKRNYRTNIIGNLFTSTTNWNVVILPGYSGDDENIDVVTFKGVGYQVDKSAWDGTNVATPYTNADGDVIIGSAAQLAGFAGMVNGTYDSSSPSNLRSRATEPNNFNETDVYLLIDVDLGGNSWTPIGMSDKIKFCGNFDGMGNTVSNFKIEQIEYTGFFGGIADADSKWNGKPRSIKNLNIANAEIKGAHFVGAIAGHLSLSVESTLSGCSVDNVKIIGYDATNSDGKERKQDKMGILVGYLQADRGFVTNNHVSNSTLTCKSFGGSIAGYRAAGTYVIHEVTNNTATNITINVVTDDSNGYFGELFGYCGEAKGVENEANNIATNVVINSTAWDGTTTTEISPVKETIDGEEVEVYNVYTAAGLAYMAKTEGLEDAYIKINANIDLGGEEWAGLGASSRKASSGIFSGTIDGQGYTISNFEASNDKEDECAALINTATDATIKNLNITGAKVKGYDTAAGLVGYLTGESRIENCNVEVELEDIYPNDSKTFSAAIGGVVGRLYGKNCVISECTVSGTIKANGEEYNESKVGGIVGLLGANYASGSTIEKCTNNATISGSSKFGLGGIVGVAFVNQDITITECVNNGNITNNRTTYYNLSGAGGIVGGAQSINFNGTDDRFIITYCTNTGNIASYLSPGAFVGALVNSSFDTSTCTNTGTITLLTQSN